MRLIAEDLSHSDEEERFYCSGVVKGGVLTVRFRSAGLDPNLWGRVLAAREEEYAIPRVGSRAKSAARVKRKAR